MPHAGDWLIVGMVAWQAAAAGVYAWAGDVRQALVWAGAAASNAAYLTMTRGG